MSRFTTREGERISNRGQSSDRRSLVVRIGKKNATSSKRASSSRVVVVVVVHAHHPNHTRREISPLRSPLKEERQRERGRARKKESTTRAKERKHDARKKHRTYVDVNSFASLRTGRSNTLKSKFKDVIDDDDAGRVCFFLPFKKGRKCDDSDGVKRDKKGL